MKHIIILGDGMADHKVERLGGKTLLQYARPEYMNRLAKAGRTGRLVTVPENFPPGSEVANTAILGYDLNKVYEEAADAMNYFEEQGIAPDMEGDGEPRKESHHSPYGIPDMDFASMYPGISPAVSGPSTFTGITFKGTGTIMELPNSGGQATVVPDKGVNSISAGDFIVDTRTGKQAVYGTDKNWYIVSS